MTPQPCALRRLHDWPERLASHIDANRARPFNWGPHDCVTFAAASVLATTGANLLPAHWDTAAGAARLLRKMGGLSAAVDTVLPRLPSPAHAQRGDILLVRAERAGRHIRRTWLAVCDGQRWWAPADQRLQHGSMAAAVTAWGVGHG